MKGFDVIIKLFLKLPKFGGKKLLLKMLKFWALTIQSCGKLKLKLLQHFSTCQPWALKGSNSMGNDVDLEKDHNNSSPNALISKKRSTLLLCMSMVW